ncbi:peroxisomal membrane protein PMP34 isoform X2 [Narcine bancroftii]
MKAKSTLVVMANIIKEEGLPAVYRSWFPAISSLCCSNFVYFYTFNMLKKFWLQGQPSSNSKDLVMGFVSGVVNVLVTTPLWVVNTRMKLQGSTFRGEGLRLTNYTGIVDGVTTMMREEGIRALWSGTCPSLLLVLNPAINFMVYEGLKRQLLQGRPELLSLEVFVIGAIAKTIATMLTYPLQTVQSLLRFGHKKAGGQRGVLGSLRHMLYLLRQRVRTQGFLGLYKGLEAKLLQTILTSALMFLVYERIAGFVFRITGLVPRGRN